MKNRTSNAQDNEYNLLSQLAYLDLPGHIAKKSKGYTYQDSDRNNKSSSTFLQPSIDSVTPIS